MALIFLHYSYFSQRLINYSRPTPHSTPPVGTGFTRIVEYYAGVYVGTPT